MVRQEKAKPVLDDLDAWLHAQLIRISGKSPLQQLVTEIIEPFVRKVPLDRIVRENAVESLHQSKFLTSLCVHRHHQVRACIEPAMHLRVTAAAKGNSVTRVKLSACKERLSAYLVGRELRA